MAYYIWAKGQICAALTASTANGMNEGLGKQLCQEKGPKIANYSS